MVKNCSKCGVEKQLNLFGKTKKSKDGYRGQCNSCRNSYLKYWSSKNKEKRRDQKYRTRYGTSIEAYNDMLRSQYGCCAICLSTAPKIGKYFVIDHCHKTAKIRGLLCRNCNSAIGLLEENIKFLENSILYLKKHKNLKAC